MTVSSQVSSVSYLGDGVTTLLPVPYYFLEQEHLTVTRVNLDTTTQTLILGSDYSVAGAGNQAGGSVTMFVAPASGVQIIIDRTVPATQETDYVANDPFPAESHERALDKLTMLVQQNVAGLGRALLRPIGKSYYDAEGRQIKNLADPTDDQDAATLRWATDFIASILATGQGPINNAANVIFAGANGFIGVAQDLANKLDPQKGSRMLGHDGWTVGEHLAGLKYPGQFASIKDWAASGGNLGIVGGTYICSEQITFPSGAVVTTHGEVVLDFSAVTSAANFPDLATVCAGSLERYPLPKLTSASAGALTLTFASAHGLVAGDVFAIWNPADASYSPGHRPAYHDGEFCKVAAVVSSTQVILQSPLAATYVVANIDLYKLPAKSLTINGSLKVRGSDTVTSLTAFKGHQLMDCSIDGLSAICPIGIAAIELQQCLSVSGTVRAEQWALSGTGNDYGIVFSGCQDMQIDGFFAASRHAITTGGYGQVCDVVNRNIQMKGTAKTTFQGGVPAVNTHGNTEGFSFEGVSYGGVSLAGNFSKIKGTIFGGPNGVCVEFTELSGHDHDLSGCLMRTLGNPGAVLRGVVDLGGNTLPSKAGTLGGTIDCRGVRIIAPNSTRGFILRNTLSTASDIKLDLRDVAVEQLAASSISLIAGKTGGSNIATLLRHGFVDNTAATQSVSSVNEVKGAEANGKVILNTTTGVSSVSFPVAYPAGLFGGVAPNVVASISSAVIGTKGISYSCAAQSDTGFTATISTVDGTNFASAVAVTFGYTAKSNK